MKIYFQEMSNMKKRRGDKSSKKEGRLNKVKKLLQDQEVRALIVDIIRLILESLKR